MRQYFELEIIQDAEHRSGFTDNHLYTSITRYKTWLSMLMGTLDLSRKNNIFQESVLKIFVIQLHEATRVLHIRQLGLHVLLYLGHLAWEERIKYFHLNQRAFASRSNEVNQFVISTSTATALYT